MTKIGRQAGSAGRQAVQVAWGSSVLDVKEDDNASDVINDVLFPLPLFKRSAHQILRSALRIALQEERINDVGNLLVLEELPDSVARQNYDLIRRCHAQLGNLGHGIHAHSARHLVAEGASHGEARDLFILQPDALRSHLVTVTVSVRVDSTACSNDHFCFKRVIRLVIAR